MNNELLKSQSLEKKMTVNVVNLKIKRNHSLYKFQGIKGQILGQCHTNICTLNTCILKMSEGDTNTCIAKHIKISFLLLPTSLLLYKHHILNFILENFPPMPSSQSFLLVPPFFWSVDWLYSHSVIKNSSSLIKKRRSMG